MSKDLASHFLRSGHAAAISTRKVERRLKVEAVARPGVCIEGKQSLGIEWSCIIIIGLWRRKLTEGEEGGSI